MKIFQKIIGKINNLEKIYIYIFVISILSGIAYGTFNLDYYKCCEEALDIQEDENAATIFISNLILAGTNLVTAGLSSIYFNFHTFSITSSFLQSRETLFVLPFLFIHGIPELFGAMLFGLSGLSIVEKKILKRKSFLNSIKLLKFGFLFLFIGALIEIGIFYLLGG